MEVVLAELQKSCNLKRIESGALEEELFEKKVEIKSLKRKLSQLAPEIEVSKKTVKCLQDQVDEGIMKKKLRNMII